MRSRNTKASIKQRISCFLEALPSLLKEAKEYEAKKMFPNTFIKPKKR